MTCTSDRVRRRWPVLALAAALVGSLALGGPAVADDDPTVTLLRQARVALGRGDGIAAEVALRQAQNAGVPRNAIAARMGEALLDQGELRKAREWLGAGDFIPAEAAHGWRMLGRLEMAAGNLPAAGKAFDRVLQLTPRDSRLWVDISRLRYQGGEQLQALAAADQAVRLDQANVRAIEWRGLLVRDSNGLAAALPWFQAGLEVQPEDLSLLGEYAATLGELGRAREMLIVTRRMIAIDPRNAKAFYLQAVLAARAGDVPLARQLLARAGPRAIESPAGLLLSGSLELEAGNTHLAVELLLRLVRMQPENPSARLLLARAMAAAGNNADLVDRFGKDPQVAAGDPYLATVLARAQESRGRRDEAAVLLDAAARPQVAPLVVGVTSAIASSPAMAELLRVRQLAAAKNLGGADAAARRILADVPGSAAARVIAGDVRFMNGNYPGALEHYRAAATIRMTDALMLRIEACLIGSGQGAAARQFTAQVRSAWPRNALALRLQAGFAAQDGQWREAAAALRHLAAAGLGRDLALQTDLAVASLRSGDAGGAVAAAGAAAALQPLSIPATQSYALALQAVPASRGDAVKLSAKVQRLR